MKIRLAVAGLAAVAVLAASAGGKGLIECEGLYRPHVQGLECDSTNIWWSYTTTLVKTDLSGKVLRKVHVQSHHGDPCLAGGKLYVPVNLGRFNTETNAQSWVYVYNADDLAFIERHPVPELRHGAGGMAYAGGDFYVVGGLPTDHVRNYVYRYSPDFRFKRRYELNTGYTGKGIQTAAFLGGKFYFGCYAGKDCHGNAVPAHTLVCPADLKSFRRSPLNASYGLVELDGRFMVAGSSMFCIGKDKIKGADGLKVDVDYDRQGRCGRGCLRECKVETSPLKVLAVGNSFTLSLANNMDLDLAAKAAGADLEYAIMYIGGCPLSRHWSNVEKAGDTNFLPYAVYTNTRKGNFRSNIPQMLKADRWDVVTLQQASAQSFRPESFEPYFGRLVEAIRRHAPQAEIVIQQTWSYCAMGDNLEKCGAGTQVAMYEGLTRAYKAVADRYGLRIIPAGLAVEKARDARHAAFVEPTARELAAFVQPAVPGMRGEVVGRYRWRVPGKAVGSGEKAAPRLCGDAIHLNREGEYLQACTWLKFLFPEADVLNLGYRPENIGCREAQILRMAASAAAVQGL